MNEKIHILLYYRRKVKEGEEFTYSEWKKINWKKRKYIKYHEKYLI